MKTRLKSGFLTIVLFASIPTVLAQEPRPAEQLVGLTRVEQAMQTMEAGIIQGIEQGWLRRVEDERQRRSPEHIDRMTKMLPEFQAMMQEEMAIFRNQILPPMLARAAAFYEERLSSEELEELVEVLQRPAVQKLFDLQPEAGQIGVEVALQHTTAFQQRIDRRFNELIRRATEE